MEYRVISAFNDRLDSGFLYKVGAAYPREGMSAADDRIAELLGSDNLQHKPLIEAVGEEAEATQMGSDETVPVPKKKRGKKNEDN